MRGIYDITRLLPRPNRFTVRYVDEELLEITFHRPTKATVKLAAAEFEQAFDKILEGLER